MKRKIHVAIGIPVFNEEANIRHLLLSLFQQKHDTFVLDKIIVVCDGSTDDTVSIVKNLSKQYLKLTCIYDPIRRGVTYRTQQLIDLNTSDILVFFDGDTVPHDSYTLGQLVAVFSDASIQLATARLEPIHPYTGFEHMLFAWRSVWDALAHKWKNGDNIYNFRGVGIAIRKDFAKSVRLPKGITGASSHFLYFSAKRRSLKTVFCKTASIYYRLATTLSDYLLQLNRGQHDDHILKSMFPEIYEAEYSIPIRIRIYNIFKNMIYIPLNTIMGLAFHIVIPFLNRQAKPSDKNGTWGSVKSTKILMQDHKISNI